MASTDAGLRAAAIAPALPSVHLAAAALAAAVLALGPRSVHAQAADTARAPAGVRADTVEVDSLLRRLDALEERLSRLRGRLDSLLAERADTAAADGGLAALRKAAEEAAEEARAAAEDTTGGGESRTRSLQALNPEISVTGDVVGSFASPGGPADADATAVPRGVEVSLQAALDPSTRAKVFVVREEEPRIAGFGEEGEGEEGEEGGVEVEEAYVYWVGLPGGLGAKLGRFRQRFGLYNRWHDHALPEVDRPLPYRAFLGGALIQTGGGLTAPSFGVGPSTNTVAVEVTRGGNEALFEGGDELTYSARWESFLDLGPASFLQLGSSGVHGENDEEKLTSRVLGFDAYFRWRPPGRGLYRDLQVKAEWFLADRDTGGRDLDGHGGYLQASYRLDRRWVLGGRADWVDPLGPGPDVTQLVPSVTWWQSEWVRLRLQYNWVRPDPGPDSHSLLFQVVWAMGPHKHEEY